MKKRNWIILLCLVFLFMSVNVFADEVGPKLITGGKRDMLWPVPSSHIITSCFYDQRNVSPTYPYGNHFAIDIGGGPGADIVASYRGTVAAVYNGCTQTHHSPNQVDNCGYYGNYVVLRHNYVLNNGSTIALFTRYNHMSSVKAGLKVGDEVSAGTVIGYVGATGSADGNHCDFQILEAATNSSWQDRHTYSRDPFSNELLELPSDVTSKDGCAYGASYLSKIKKLYSTTPSSYPNPIYNKSYWGPQTATTRRPVVEIRNPETVSKVQFVIWTTPDQSDLKRYDANYNGYSSWFYDFEITDFTNRVFLCHVYVYGKNGSERSYNLTSEIQDPIYDTSYWGNQTETTRRPVVAIRNPDFVEKVQFAVWTTTDQSDLQWFDANYNGHASWFYDFEITDFTNRNFQCHVYIYGKNGSVRSFILTSEVPDPVCQMSYWSQLNETTIRPVVAFADLNTVERVQLAVWTADNQSDVKWYDANSNGYGSYFYDVPVYDFENKIFRCTVSVYGKNGSIQSILIPEAYHLGDHQWGTPSYDWNDEANTLTATYICTLSSDHVKTEVIDDPHVFRLPAQLQEIEEEAFTGLSCQVVIIQEGCTTIDSRAFADCDELLYVAIPSTVTSIAPDAFEGCNKYLPAE